MSYTLSQYTFQKQDNITEILLNVALKTITLLNLSKSGRIQISIRYTSIFIYIGKVFQWRKILQDKICLIYIFKALWFLAPLLLKNNLVSNILTLSVPDEGYTWHVSCTLNYISTFLFKLTLFLRDNETQ